MQKFPVACVFGVALVCSVVLSVSPSSVEGAPRPKGRAPKPAVVAAPQPVPAPSAVESTLSALRAPPTWSDAESQPLPFPLLLRMTPEEAERRGYLEMPRDGFLTVAPNPPPGRDDRHWSSLRERLERVPVRRLRDLPPGDSSGLRFRGSRRGEVRRQFDGRDVPDTTQLPQPRPQRQRGHLHIRSRGILCFDPRGHGSAATCATLRRAL